MGWRHRRQQEIGRCRVQASDVNEGCLVVHETKYLVRGLRDRRTESTWREAFPHSPAQAHFCMPAIRNGGSLAALQQMLGHSTIVVTQRYARLGDDLVKAEANRVYRSQTVASDRSQAS